MSGGTLLTIPIREFSEHSCPFPVYTRLCTKNPVSTLTHWSTRPFRSHCEGFFATKEACFYFKKSYKGTTFGAKPSIPHESASHSRGYEHPPSIAGKQGRVHRRRVTPARPAGPSPPASPPCQSP